MVVTVHLAGAASATGAQQTQSTITAAEQLRQEGRYAEAADSLLAYLRTNPGDMGVHWRAAQLLHQAGLEDAAALQYDAAVGLAPADPWLRLEYADLLVSLGRFDQAGSMALAVAESRESLDEARARALTLLGTLAYWRGDLSSAVGSLEAALTLDPDREDAAHTLAEIREITRPWARLALERMDDNQPYRRARVELGGGLFLTPLWTAELDLVPRVLDQPAAGGVESAVRESGEARVTLNGYLPGARVEVTAGLGGVLQGEAAWIGHAGLTVRLPQQLRLRARVERVRYLWTTASADTLLFLEPVELALSRAEHPRWAGEVAVRREAFPDGNRVSSAHAWLLAPVVPGLRMGAAASWQDASETRWSLALERYVPYYTPEEQRIASILAEVRVPLGSATARLNGSWGAWARERAPMPDASSPGNSPGGPSLVFEERSYTPWNVTASLDAPAGERLSLHIEAERRETAFYDLTRGSVAVLIHLGRPSRR